MAKTAEEKLKLAQEEEAKARARVRALQAELAGKARKVDAKRKIILGAWLIENYPDTVFKAVAGLKRAQDKALFEGWTPPPKKTPAAAPQQVRQA